MDINPFKTDTQTFIDLISESSAQKIIKAGTLVKYDDGQLIHSRGDTKPGISIVKSGIAYVGNYGYDGSFVMTSILGPGQTFGEFTLFADLPRTHDVTAVGTTEIYQISGARFIKLHNQEPDISKALLSRSLIRTHLLLEIMDAMRRLPLRERAAKVLLILYQTSGDGQIFKCRQSDLAFALGLSRMSINKALSQLSNLNLIELGYGEVRIPDTDKMEKWLKTQIGYF